MTVSITDSWLKVCETLTLHCNFCTLCAIQENPDMAMTARVMMILQYRILATVHRHIQLLLLLLLIQLWRHIMDTWLCISDPAPATTDGKTDAGKTQINHCTESNRHYVSLYIVITKIHRQMARYTHHIYTDDVYLLYFLHLIFTSNDTEQ